MAEVSVIIPVYNVEKYLVKCLDSVVNQTLKDIEIICIDDGSSDNSLNILKDYAAKDSRFVILMQKNLGAASARTKGMKIAKGNYIGFVDSDDWIDLNYYETLYEKAVKENADVVRTTYKIGIDNVIKDVKSNRIIRKRAAHNRPLKKNEHNTVIWDAIYRLQFLRDNHIDYFDENLLMCHDVPFSARVDILSMKTSAVCGTYYYYRKGRNGQLITPTIDRIKYSLMANIITTNFLNSVEIDSSVYKKAYKHCMWRMKYNFKQGLKFKEFDKEEQDKYLKVCKSISSGYKCSKLFGYENNLIHKTLTLFGIKLRFKNNKHPERAQLPEYLKSWYREKTGKYLDLENPKTFNEKMQWLKLYDCTPQKTLLADKYLVRDWVKEKIGEEYLVPLLGVWDNFDEIDFSKLPEQFVLKCNHGSGYNIIVTDKSTLNLNDARKKINKWMKEDFAYKAGFEMHYSGIPRKIIAEKYISPQESDTEIQAYCFDGEIKFISYESCKDSKNSYRCIFSPDWTVKDFRISPQNHEDFASTPPKPENLEEFKKLANILCKNFKFVRIDFISSKNKLMFREMTFTSGSGLSTFSPENVSLEIGNYLKINNI